MAGQHEPHMMPCKSGQRPARPACERVRRQGMTLDLRQQQRMMHDGDAHKVPGQGIEPHPVVPGGAGLPDHPLDQPAPPARAPRRGEDVEPFHFARPGLERPECHASGGLISVECQKQTSPGTRIGAREVAQFLGESLEAEIDLQ